MPIYAIFLLVVLNCLPASGQRKVVVLDARNHIPVVGASVCTGGTAVLTDRGGVVLLPEIGDTVAFMHRHYFSERLQRFELRDTIFMERIRPGSGTGLHEDSLWPSSGRPHPYHADEPLVSRHLLDDARQTETAQNATDHYPPAMSLPRKRHPRLCRSARL